MRKRIHLNLLHLIHHTDEDRQVRRVVNDHIDERAVENDIPHLHHGVCPCDDRSHRRRTGPLLIDGNKGLVDHVGDVDVVSAFESADAAEVGFDAVERVRHTERFQCFGHLAAVFALKLRQTDAQMRRRDAAELHRAGLYDAHLHQVRRQLR